MLKLYAEAVRDDEIGEIDVSLGGGLSGTDITSKNIIFKVICSTNSLIDAADTSLAGGNEGIILQCNRVRYRPIRTRSAACVMPAVSA